MMFSIRFFIVGILGILFWGNLYAATIALSCGAVGQEMHICKEGANAWAKKTGHEVKLISTPNSASERLALYQQLLAAGASDIDVFQIDVVWPSLLANHFIDLKPFTKGVEKEHFPAIVKNNTVKNRLVGMPWFTDAGLLYYRKDLLKKYKLKVPVTWKELTANATTIQEGERKAGKSKFWGFTWQGRAYEGLTCDALEWIFSFKGGTIIEPNGKISVNNEMAIAAIDMARGWVGTITPTGILNYAEEDARGVFQSGNAAFMRNWPYAWSLAQNTTSPIKGKVAVAALPKGGKDGQHAGTLGGWQLGVSKYSKHKEIAADLVMYLTSAQEQKRRALVGAYNPTLMALYKDKDILKKAPFVGELYNTFINAVARPSTVTGRKYNQVSTDFYNAVHQVISGKMSAKDSLKKLHQKLTRLSRGGRW